MKIESETSIRKLSFLSRLPEDIKIACPVSYISYSTFLTFLLLGDWINRLLLMLKRNVSRFITFIHAPIHLKIVITSIKIK